MEQRADLTEYGNIPELVGPNPFPYPSPADEEETEQGVSGRLGLLNT